MANREQVHKTKSGKELQSRLEGNRLGFGLFHEISGKFPLAMVYVALSSNFPNTIDARIILLLLISRKFLRAHPPLRMDHIDMQCFTQSRFVTLVLGDLE